jgi:hypothetical protein
VRGQADVLKLAVFGALSGIETLVHFIVPTLPSKCTAIS